MIDIHTHLLPNIDDGPEDIDTTLKMIEIYKNEGVSSVIATPHYYLPKFENIPNVIKEKVESVNNILKENNIDFKIYPGSEVFVSKHILEDIKQGRIQTLNDTRYILLEFDFKKFPSYGLDLIYEIHLLGYRVIVAHPERYEYVIDDITFLNSLIDEGCLIQLNSSSLTGIFGKEVKKTALKIVENGSYNFIATDAHTLNKRGPYLCEAITILNKYNKSSDKYLKEMSENLLNNVEICNKLNKFNKKRSIFDFFIKK
ncbi:tyrosine-protein phosphatase [Thermobrachium celere]|uniref:tyrosine-protein phosphatase n=1 Tax=Thermobrachium celere TaxID=53422 RepID=UPI00194297C9|nr:CpsB/CapC family capsule biosynthesis tyrosine phosphatase [Thermobrachium celere]GFR35683.1 phosphoesterase [Thermobrachium celere]